MRDDFFLILFIPFIPVNFIFCVLCSKYFPQIPQHHHRQRHSEQQTPLRDKKDDHRIAPAKLIADRIIAREVTQKIENPMSRFPKILETPEKSEAPAEKQKRGNYASDELIVCDPGSKSLKN